MMGVRLEVKTRGNPGDYSLWSLTKYVFNGCPLTTITTYHCLAFHAYLSDYCSIAAYYMMWKWLLASCTRTITSSVAYYRIDLHAKVINRVMRLSAAFRSGVFLNRPPRKRCGEGYKLCVCVRIQMCGFNGVKYSSDFKRLSIRYTLR